MAGRQRGATFLSGRSAWLTFGRHARRAFEASDRLLNQAAQGGGGGSSTRFQTAATRYARTLRSLSGQSAGLGGGGESGIRGGSGTSGSGTSGTSAVAPRVPAPRALPASTSGSGLRALPALAPRVPAARALPEAAPPPARCSGIPAGSGLGGGAGLGAGSWAGSMLGGHQSATLAVLNHGVKEALDSMQLKQMVNMMGASDRPAARALLAHAREMDAESREAVNRVLAMSGRSGGNSGAGAGTSAWLGSRSGAAGEKFLRGLPAVVRCRGFPGPRTEAGRRRGVRVQGQKPTNGASAGRSAERTADAQAAWRPPPRGDRSTCSHSRPRTS